MSSSSSYLGLLRIGDYHFALPASVLQEVVSKPAMTALPEPGPLGSGTFRLGRTIVPCFDLASIFTGVACLAQSRALVAILRHEDSILGLEIDGVRKLVRRDDCDLTELRADDGEQSHRLFTQHFWDSETATTVGILNADALIRTPGIRFAQATSLQDRNATQVDLATLHLALFRVNGRTFGVDVQHVRQALHAGKITLSSFSTSVLHGHYLTATQHIPIIRLIEFLGLPVQEGYMKPERGLVVGLPEDEAGHEGPNLGFLIEDVVGAIKAPLTDLHRLANSGMQRTHLYRGVLSTRDLGYVLVLDTDALLKDPEVAGLARGGNSGVINTGSQTSSVGSESEAFLVYRAGGGTLATSLKDLEAVVPLPQIFSLSQTGDAFLGVMPWRGITVNLLDVGALTGSRSISEEPGCDVLIVKESTAGSTTHYGFLVTKVESLVTATLQPAPLLSRPKLAGCLQRRSAELTGNLITVRTGDSCRNITVLNVHELVQTMAGDGITLDSSSSLTRI